MSKSVIELSRANLHVVAELMKEFEMVAKVQNAKSKTILCNNWILDENEYQALVQVLTADSVAATATVIKSDLY